MPHPSAHRLVPDCRVSAGGAALAIDKDAALTRVEVDLDTSLFGQCVLTFNDPKLVLINGRDFASGTAIKVEIGFHTKLQKVFEGEVVALEPQFRRDLPPSLRVICQESLHRLALSQMTRTFNNVDDKEIVTRIAREHGLTAQAPAGTKEHILQGNITDAAFLRRIAAKSGNSLRIEGKKLIVGPPRKGAQVQVAPGDGLRKVSVRIKANSQVSEVSVHGWDPKAKREIGAKAKPQGAMQQGAKAHGGSAILSLAGHGYQPPDVATAEAMAKGRLRKIAEGFVTAEVEMLGNPQILPGAQVEVQKLGAPIDGTWRVDHATHLFNRHGYWVRFRAVRIAQAKLPPKSPQPGAQKAPVLREPPPPDVHLIHLELKAIGGTPLPNQTVRILDAATGKQVGELQTTDERGTLFARVPENKKYRVELLDHDLPAAAPPLHSGAEAALLRCPFVDLSGSPIAGEKVSGKTAGEQFELTTDAEGAVTSPARLQAYQLTLRGETFTAHAQRAEDGEARSRFVVGEAGPSDLHVLVTEVKSVGGTLLVNHPVRVLHPDSGEEVAYAVTDGKGVLRVEVPESRSYSIEIADEDEQASQRLHFDDPGALLRCCFVDGAGSPIAFAKVRGSRAGEEFELVTDASGMIETPARLEAVELTLGGESFIAYALPLADQEKEGRLYRFVAGEAGPLDAHVVSAEVKAIGGTPLVNHPVRIVDPDTGMEVAYAVTDGAGVLRAEVPEARSYRVEIADEESELLAPPLHPGDEVAQLVCQFVDGDGLPVANERVEASAAGEKFELRTDEEGRIDSPARLVAYQLEIRGSTFSAHALPAREGEKEKGLYRFVVPG